MIHNCSSLLVIDCQINDSRLNKAEAESNLIGEWVGESSIRSYCLVTFPDAEVGDLQINGDNKAQVIVINCTNSLARVR